MGAIIGSRWANVKRLEADSGARITIDNPTTTVTIVGTTDAARAGLLCTTRHRLTRRSSVQHSAGRRSFAENVIEARRLSDCCCCCC